MWYYMLNNERFGPVSENSIRDLLANGTINIDTLVWTEGMTAWVKFSQSSLVGGMQLPPSAPTQTYIQPGQPQPGQSAGGSARKDRVAYILLAVLLGIGIHNFYAGYKRNGLIQLVGTVLSCGLFWIPMWIWSVVEACTVTVDAEGVPFK